MAALKKQQQDLTAKLEAAEGRAITAESKLAEAKGNAGGASESRWEELTKVVCLGINYFFKVVAGGIPYKPLV